MIPFDRIFSTPLPAIQAIFQRRGFANERAGSKFGLELATLINLLNPEAIVLAGGTLRWQSYLNAALQSVQLHSLPDLRSVCRIEVNTFRLSPN